MSAEELLTLPVRTEVRWEDYGLNGTVSARNDTSMTILWSDGSDSIVSSEDTDISELAASLEVVAQPAEELPHVVSV